jgi:hypothetical protein
MKILRKLKREIKLYMTESWSPRARDNEFPAYLEKEIKPKYPNIYKLLTRDEAMLKKDTYKTFEKNAKHDTPGLPLLPAGEQGI